jgi:hypothetical protein
MAVTKIQTNWFGRHWKLVLSAIGLGVVLSWVLCIGAFVFFIFGTMKSGDPYQQALTKIRASSAAQQSLGTPIHDGWFVTGSLGVSGSSGNADMSFPVSGPKGSGIVHMVAFRYNGKWIINKLELTVNGSGRKINLLEKQ